VNDPLEAAVLVAAALEAAGVSYSVGGSLASSLSGEPRASIDADLVVDMKPDQILPFLAALGNDFYADPDALLRAIATHSTANLIRHASGVKVDLFVAESPLEFLQLRRRRLVQISADPVRALYFHTPEDIVLQKLEWFRRGGEVSDRQWRDVVAVIAVQGTRLDLTYLTRTAASTGLSELLTRALRETSASGNSRG
jgi:hypothetical protein